MECTIPEVLAPRADFEAAVERGLEERRVELGGEALSRVADAGQ